MVDVNALWTQAAEEVRRERTEAGTMTAPDDGQKGRDLGDDASFWDAVEGRVEKLRREAAAAA